MKKIVLFTLLSSIIPLSLNSQNWEAINYQYLKGKPTITNLAISKDQNNLYDSYLSGIVQVLPKFKLIEKELINFGTNISIKNQVADISSKRENSPAGSQIAGLVKILGYIVFAISIILTILFMKITVAAFIIKIKNKRKIKIEDIDF